jgi:circadian clock protein KaiB
MTSDERVERNDLAGASPGTERWALRPYVVARTPRGLNAFANLMRVCEENLSGRHEIRVVDLLEEPALAIADQVVAVPTVVRRTPAPVRRVVGDLSDTDRVLHGLHIEVNR